MTVDYTGRLEWEPGGLYQTYCPVNVFYYPFDTQTCDITFTEWGYDSTEVKTYENLVRYGGGEFSNKRISCCFVVGDRPLFQILTFLIYTLWNKKR